MERTFEAALVEQCAPTLAGVKPANLFRFRGAEPSEIRRGAQAWDRKLRHFGVRVMILKECPAAEACMIYVYRESQLRRILAEAENRAFLEGMGYCLTDIDGLLSQLSERFCLERDYPHEIGLFLGYPLGDVVGFIENRGWNYTCCGCWKSYGDPEAAQACFQRYRKCTDLYRRLYARGISVIQLVAAA